VDSLLARYPGAIAISARTGEGFSDLAEAVSAALSRTFHDVIIETGIDNGRLLAYLNASSEVLSTKFYDERAIVHCRISAEALGRIGQDEAVIRPAENGAVANGDRARELSAVGNGRPSMDDSRQSLVERQAPNPK
jgi:GTP-binding protein HflX